MVAWLQWWSNPHQQTCVCVLSVGCMKDKAYKLPTDSDFTAQQSKMCDVEATWNWDRSQKTHVKLNEKLTVTNFRQYESCLSRVNPRLIATALLIGSFLSVLSKLNRIRIGQTFDFFA